MTHTWQPAARQSDNPIKVSVVNYLLRRPYEEIDNETVSKLKSYLSNTHVDVPHVKPT